jgi:hypothetical protein
VLPPKQFYEKEVAGWSVNGKRGRERTPFVAVQLYNTKTRTIKLNKETGHFAFHLLEAGTVVLHLE